MTREEFIAQCEEIVPYFMKAIRDINPTWTVRLKEAKANNEDHVKVYNEYKHMIAVQMDSYITDEELKLL